MTNRSAGAARALKTADMLLAMADKIEKIYAGMVEREMNEVVERGLEKFWKYPVMIDWPRVDGKA